MIQIEHVSGGYRDQVVIKDVSFQVEAGEMFGIIGPNGSGKTTLMKMMSQVLPSSDGEIRIQGRPLSSYSAKELAQLIAVLPQITMQTFNYTVLETVALGRYAHQRGLFPRLSKEDDARIQEVMAQTGIDQYAHVSLEELSGGERQRVFLAQALAQEPTILFLDEPTNHLDLSFQKELLDLLRQWSRERNLTVVAIFHDLNLASLYCDRLLLLNGGEVDICASPELVLEKSRIKKVYQTKVENHPHPEVPKPQMMLVPEDQSLESKPIHEGLLQVSEDRIVLEASSPLKTMASGVTGSGLGWYRTFLNRRVSETYDSSQPQEEMGAYLKDIGLIPHETVSMMTTGPLEGVSYQSFREGKLSLFLVVTASVGHALDASLDRRRTDLSLGRINTWLFVNAYLSDEAFIQALSMAAEAKVKALHDLQIEYPDYKALAAGRGTDSLLLAASQQGGKQAFADSLTTLGRLIGRGVYTCTKEAIENNLSRKT